MPVNPTLLCQEQHLVVVNVWQDTTQIRLQPIVSCVARLVSPAVPRGRVDALSALLTPSYSALHHPPASVHLDITQTPPSPTAEFAKILVSPVQEEQPPAASRVNPMLLSSVPVLTAVYAIWATSRIIRQLRALPVMLLAKLAALWDQMDALSASVTLSCCQLRLPPVYAAAATSPTPQSLSAQSVTLPVLRVPQYYSVNALVVKPTLHWQAQFLTPVCVLLVTSQITPPRIALFVMSLVCYALLLEHLGALPVILMRNSRGQVLALAYARLGTTRTRFPTIVRPAALHVPLALEGWPLTVSPVSPMLF